jgi:hypothetical protein
MILSKKKFLKKKTSKCLEKWLGKNIFDPQMWGKLFFLPLSSVLTTLITTDKKA